MYTEEQTFIFTLSFEIEWWFIENCDSMATIDKVDDNKDGKIGHKYSVKKGKRRHKTQSLFVPPKTPPSAAVRDDTCLTADCDHSTFGIRRRFSFRKFRTVRSVSKVSQPHSRSESASSIDGGSTANSPCDDTHDISQKIRSKWWQDGCLSVNTANYFKLRSHYKWCTKWIPFESSASKSFSYRFRF